MEEPLYYGKLHHLVLTTNPENEPAKKQQVIVHKEASGRHYQLAEHDESCEGDHARPGSEPIVKHAREERKY
jgi:hypothetical protein